MLRLLDNDHQSKAPVNPGGFGIGLA